MQTTFKYAPLKEIDKYLFWGEESNGYSPRACLCRIPEIVCFGSGRGGHHPNRGRHVGNIECGVPGHHVTQCGACEDDIRFGQVYTYISFFENLPKSRLQGGPSGWIVGKVGLTWILDVPLFALVCLCWWLLGRTGQAKWQSIADWSQRNLLSDQMDHFVE